MCGASTPNLVIKHDRDMILVDEIGERRKVFMASAWSSMERYEGAGVLKVANDFVPLEHQESTPTPQTRL